MVPVSYGFQQTGLSPRCSGNNNNNMYRNDNEQKTRLWEKKEMEPYSGAFVEDNGLTIMTDEDGRVTARPPTQLVRRKNPRRTKQPVREQPAKVVPSSGFNVVLTHCTADFDSLASAVGLAKLWSEGQNTATTDHHTNNNNNASSAAVDDDNDDDEPDQNINNNNNNNKVYDSKSHVPTFVVLPRGAHPGVQRFLSLHKHLFPIRSLKSLPTDLSGLNRLGLVDAQRRDRVGPAEPLIAMANRVTVVDHHIDTESDIPEATDYVVDPVGSVSTMLAERLQQAGLELTEAEATLLALGIHADTGSLCFDSTTPRDAMALAWVMQQGASQAAIAEHVQTSLSAEQQGVLTQALMNANSTVVHGVTVSTVLLRADRFINGLAAVAQDALEMSSSDIFLLALVYEAGRATRRRRGGGRRRNNNKKGDSPDKLQSRLLRGSSSALTATTPVGFTEAWMGGEEAMRRKRLRAAFDKRDTDGSGYLERREIAAALSSSGIIATESTVDALLNQIDLDGDGRIDFDEFVSFSKDAERRQQSTDKKPSTMIIIGRAKSGVNMKAVKLNRLMEPFGGGGHAKAASCTVRLDDESEAEGVLQQVVDELLSTSLTSQPCVGDFMTSPVLSASPHMTEKQVEDLFRQHDVRALPVVDHDNEVVGLVTYKEVAAAKQRLWNKEQKRLRQEAEQAARGKKKKKNKNEANPKRDPNGDQVARERKLGSALKGWMKQHVTTVPHDMTMGEVEALLLENDGAFFLCLDELLLLLFLFLHCVCCSHSPLFFSWLHTSGCSGDQSVGGDGYQNRLATSTSVLPVVALSQQGIR